MGEIICVRSLPLLWRKGGKIHSPVASSIKESKAPFKKRDYLGKKMSFLYGGIPLKKVPKKYSLELCIRHIP